MTKSARAHDLPLDEPMLLRLASLSLAARTLARGRAQGERASPAVGSGVAFAEHRPYSAGDDVRFLDWHAYARSERLYIKQYTEERDLDVHVLLDCSASMTRKLPFAKQLAALLGYVALARLDRVSLHGYASGPGTRLGPLRGRGQALGFLRKLAALEAAGTTALDATARDVCARSPRGGVALVLSDGLDDDSFLRGIDRLRYGGLAPTVLQLLDPGDLALPHDTELTLVDSESGRTEVVRATSAWLARVREAREVAARALASTLRARGVPCLALSVELPLERALASLVTRGIVG